MRALTAFALILISTTSLWAGREFVAAAGDDTVPGEVVIKLRPGYTLSGILARYLPSSVTRSLPALNTHVIRIPSGDLPGSVIRLLAADAGIEFAEQNHMRKARLTPANDPGLSTQWALQTVQAADAWGLIPGRYLTSSTTGATRIKIAVLDTGIDCTHPDFKNVDGSSTNSANGGQLLYSASAALTPTTVANPQCAWQDDYGHGTHVAGIIAASANNSTGVAGLAYNVQLVSIRVLDQTGSASDDQVAKGIIMAADAGVQIISMSLGGIGYSQLLQDAIEYAYQRNVLIICAAGNNSSNSLVFPAGALHAIGVSATNSSNTLASFSNYGDYVEIAAPGVGIYSTLPTYSNAFGSTNYGSLSGTSMATPHVSAVAGLIATANPGMSAAAIAQLLQQTASSTAINGGWTPDLGYGVVNAYKAVSNTIRFASIGAVRGQITDPSGTPLPTGAQVTLNGQTVSTDATSGLFRFPAVLAGTYPITITAAGYATQNLTLTVAPGADTVFAASMGVSIGKITGAVKDLGVPVPYAIVHALSGSLIKATAVADNAGQYTLWVPSGSYTVVASAVYSSSVGVPVTVTAPGSSTANVVMTRLGRITGRVTNSGTPVSGAQVQVSNANYSAGAITDANGYYTTPGLVSGTYLVAVSPSGLPPASTPNVAVAVDSDTTTNFALTNTSQASSSATFVKLDTTTQGNWRNAYGADGYIIVGDQTSTPSYVTPVANGQMSYVWTSSTSDIRALQKASNPSDRIAGTWYSWDTFTVDLTFADQAQHQVALYCVDWDRTDRRQKVDILDSNGVLLNSQSLTSSFNGGVYLVWNVSGKVRIRVTLTGGLNDVVSGIFFGSGTVTAPPPPPPPPPSSSSTATFVKVDTTTQGNWRTAYGTDGYSIAGDLSSNPPYAAPSTTGDLYTWSASTSDPRALQKASNPSDRIAATWYSWTSFTIDVNITDQQQHQVAFYCLDWDLLSRVQAIDAVDANGTVLATKSLSNFSSGSYVVWNVTGHVIFRFTVTGGRNTVVAGIFFGGAASQTPQPASTSAAFVKTDLVTQGSWHGVYGSKGYAVAADQTANPTFAVPAFTAANTYIWAPSTSEVRALENGANTGRIASTWYSWTSFSVDLNITGQTQHQVALYCLDWDATGRIQTVEVLDSSGAVLDARSLSNFSQGAYLVWNITGTVKFRFTVTGGRNTVLSGIFFD